MKLKYKKIILLTTMSTMGIGLLTLSISRDYPKAEESLKTAGVKQESSELADSDENAMSSLMMFNEEAVDIEALPTPTPEPTPTPTPVYTIEEDSSYPEINQLFNNYYTAKQSCDVEKLESILSDPSRVETIEQLQSKTEYIDNYKNIKAYIKKCFTEGNFIVYVYYEIKFTSVTTPAPALTKFYVITDKDGNLKIFSGEMDEELKKYYDARNNDEDVQQLIQMTDDLGEAAKSKDEDLQKFWEDIDNIANNNTAE